MRLLEIAQSYQGTPYVLGGPLGRVPGDTSSCDCSGYVAEVFSHVGVQLTPFTDAMYGQTEAEPNPAPGSLIFYRYSDPGQAGVTFPHVDIYLGGDQAIGCIWPDGVTVHQVLTLPHEFRRVPGAVGEGINAAGGVVDWVRAHPLLALAGVAAAWLLLRDDNPSLGQRKGRRMREGDAPDLFGGLGIKTRDTGEDREANRREARREMQRHGAKDLFAYEEEQRRNPSKRDLALAQARRAGYQNDTRYFTRLLVESRVNRQAMHAAWAEGARRREAEQRNPLVHGSSRRAIGENLRRELQAGKPRKQAVAIALEESRRAENRNPSRDARRRERPASCEDCGGSFLQGGYGRLRGRHLCAPCYWKRWERGERPRNQRRSQDRNPEFFTVHHRQGRRHWVDVHPIRESSGYDPEVEEVQAEVRQRERQEEAYGGHRQERSDIVRPPWGVGISNAELIRIARKYDTSPYRDGWWEEAGLYSGMGELRYELEAGQHRSARHRTKAPTRRKRAHSTRRRDAEYDDLPF